MLELSYFEPPWPDDEAILNRPHFPSELDLMKYPDDSLHQILVMAKCHLIVAESFHELGLINYKL